MRARWQVIRRDRTIRDDRYRRKLLRLLSSATFFEGYDNFVLSFVLALVLVDLGGTETQAGAIRAIMGLGGGIRTRPPARWRGLMRLARRSRLATEPPG